MLIIRRILLSVVVVAALAVTVTVAWAFWPGTSITRENAAKITKGMMLADVQTLLGGCERIDTTGPTEGDADDAGEDADEGPSPELATERFGIALSRVGRTSRLVPGSVTRVWGSDRVAIFVAFDAGEHVIDVAVRPLRRAPESPIEVLRRWLCL
jgi:hypothetical protein